MKSLVILMAALMVSMLSSVGQAAAQGAYKLSLFPLVENQADAGAVANLAQGLRQMGYDVSNLQTEEFLEQPVYYAAPTVTITCFVQMDCRYTAPVVAEALKQIDPRLQIQIEKHWQITGEAYRGSLELRFRSGFAERK